MKLITLVTILSVLSLGAYANENAEIPVRYWDNSLIKNTDMVDQLFRELKHLELFDPDTGVLDKDYTMTLYINGVQPEKITEDYFELHPMLLDAIEEPVNKSYLVVTPYIIPVIDQEFDRRASMEAYLIGGWYPSTEEMFFDLCRKYPEYKDADDATKFLKTQELCWFAGPLPSSFISKDIPPTTIGSFKKLITSNQDVTLIIGCSLMTLMCLSAMYKFMPKQNVET